MPACAMSGCLMDRNFNLYGKFCKDHYDWIKNDTIERCKDCTVEDEPDDCVTDWYSRCSTFPCRKTRVRCPNKHSHNKYCVDHRPREWCRACIQESGFRLCDDTNCTNDCVNVTPSCISTFHQEKKENTLVIPVCLVVGCSEPRLSSIHQLCCKHMECSKCTSPVTTVHNNIMLCKSCAYDYDTYTDTFAFYVKRRFGTQEDAVKDAIMHGATMIADEGSKLFKWNDITIEAINRLDALHKIVASIDVTPKDFSKLAHIHARGKPTFKYIIGGVEKEIFNVHDNVETVTFGDDEQIVTSILEWMIDGKVEEVA